MYVQRVVNDLSYGYPRPSSDLSYLALEHIAKLVHLLPDLESGSTGLVDLNTVNNYHPRNSYSCTFSTEVKQMLLNSPQSSKIDEFITISAIQKYPYPLSVKG